MATDIMIRNSELPVFVNKELNLYTNKIAKIGTRMNKNLYELAFVLAEVDEKKPYKDDGFKNVADYVFTTFGIKKSQTYALIKIGRDYTTPELTSNLPHEDGNDFSTTQIGKCLPLPREQVVELVEDKTITPDMTCAEIGKVVKSFNNDSDQSEIGTDDNPMIDDDTEKQISKLVSNAQKALDKLISACPEYAPLMSLFESINN